MTFKNELNEGLKLAFAAISANKVRAILTMLGIVIGIASVTLMGSTINGVTRAFNNSISFIGADVLYVDKWSWKDLGEWWKYRNRRDMEVRYAGEIRNDATLLSAVAPVENRTGMIKYRNRIADNVQIEGTTSDLVYVSDMNFSEGRFFSDMESRWGSPVAILGSDVAKQLFPNQDPIGKTIKINGIPDRVIGVRSVQANFMGMFALDNVVIVPL